MDFGSLLSFQHTFLCHLDVWMENSKDEHRYLRCRPGAVPGSPPRGGPGASGESDVECLGDQLAVPVCSRQGREYVLGVFLAVARPGKVGHCVNGIVLYCLENPLQITRRYPTPWEERDPRGVVSAFQYKHLFQSCCLTGV